MEETYEFSKGINIFDNYVKENSTVKNIADSLIFFLFSATVFNMGKSLNLHYQLIYHNQQIKI